ncbi:hypothetical protein F5148DRAFT_1195231 [Russula earlei]|uniref:Uncharacterized protein n=1 Tax=Russula earlei TaxID=71964 RepID=A0ACC0UCF6_9AGAM|nr:hypothetical protein F5148DRAFT_1195231 [Russula earlei]
MLSVDYRTSSTGTSFPFTKHQRAIVMQQSFEPNTEPPSPLPPAATRGSISFAWAEGQAARSRRDVPGAPSLDFDAGINTSNVWTVYLDSGGSPSHSLSDDSGEDDHFEENVDGRSARVLFAFTGKPEFRELDVNAGDEITVLREQAGEGWSLVKNHRGHMGLLPRSYYTFTVDFISAPQTGSMLPVRHLSESSHDASSASLTPRGSMVHSLSSPPPAKPIVAQTTGERMMAAFPNLRQGLFGGKSLNRFSSFVTSGAEAYVLNGTSAAKSDVPPASMKHLFEGSDDEEHVSRASVGSTRPNNATNSSETDKHFVDAGPSWRQKVPPFRILVHSPSKRTSTLSGAHIVYSVSSLFDVSTSEPSDTCSADSVNSSPNTSRITVHRRFSHFVVLHTALTRRLPGIALPPLPEKQYAGRFNDDFVEARRGDLERYLARIARHPVVRYAEILTFFLSCESEQEWRRQLPEYLALPPAGPSFYLNVLHPDFNFDTEEASEAVNRFDVHTRAIDIGVQGLRNVFTQIRQARVEMSKAERLLSYSLLSLITAKPIATLPSAGMTTQEEDLCLGSDREEFGASKEEHKKVEGYVNEEGAWCWREGCEACLKLTKAIQRTSETLQSIADIYDDHARRTQLITHEALKGVAHPSQLYAPIIDIHRNALSRYTDATQGPTPNEEVASRCETVLNTTMAEMETYHAQKVEDFATLAKEHLDGEIKFYEQVLFRLRKARRTFEPQRYSHLASGGPRQPSIYERDLERPRLNPEPLPQPCPHVFDSTPMWPVSHAIQEGVGLLLGGAANAVTGRGSMFGRFW